MKNLIPSLSLVLTFALVACGGSNFQGGQLPSIKPQNLSIITPGITAVTDGGTKTINRGDRLDIKIDAGGLIDLGTGVSTVLKPVDLIFVMDISFSMDKELNAVKQSAAQLASGLRARGIDLWVGFVGFEDSYQSITDSEFALTNNISAFESHLNGIKAGDTVDDNQDFPEGGLHGIKTAAARLLSQGRPQVLKVMVYVSDVVAHNSGPSQASTPDQVRDCTVNGAYQAISQLVAGLGNSSLFKFFYSVPRANSSAQNATHTCSGLNAETQMRNLLNYILPGVANKGGELLSSSGASAWPLSGSTLIDSLMPELQKTVTTPNRQGTCIATSAQLFDLSSNPNQPISSWASSSLSEAYSKFATTNAVTLESVFGVNNLNIAQGAHQLDMKVQRCCIETQSVGGSLPPGAACNEKSYLQSIRYNIFVN